MTLPRLLFVDDQLASTPALWRSLTRKCGLSMVSGKKNGVTAGDSIAEALVCRGQLEVSGRVLNDYAVVRNAIIDAGSGDLAAIFLDSIFISGEAKPGQPPAGEDGDVSFGEDVRQRLRLEFPNVPVIMLTSRHQGELREQSGPYLSKEGLDQRTIAQSLVRYGRLTPQQVHDALGLPEGLVARSHAMLSACLDGYVASVGVSPVLLIGEAGVGKVAFAAYMHASAGRPGKFKVARFALDPATVSDIRAPMQALRADIVQSVQDARGGTLLVENIDSLTQDDQVNLLEVIEAQTTLPDDAKVKLIFSSRVPRHVLMKSERLQAEFFYCISAQTIDIPPLRDRVEDLPILIATEFKRRAMGAGKTTLKLSEQAIKTLNRYAYPGNIPEFESIMIGLAARASNGEIVTDTQVMEHLTRQPSNVLPQALVAAAAAADVNTLGEPRHTDISIHVLLSRLEHLRVPVNENDLSGVWQRLDQTANDLQRKLAAAALIRCRHPVSGDYNLQASMRLLTGNTALKGKAPARILNAILGRKQTSPVDQTDMANLVLSCLREPV